MIVHNTQKCWGSGLCPSSRILKTRKHNVSETGFVSILRRREEEHYSDESSQIQFLKHVS
jgi:hypothetical protein